MSTDKSINLKGWDSMHDPQTLAKRMREPAAGENGQKEAAA
jgi:hypothetical protein